jgi:hypothetical protein
MKPFDLEAAKRGEPILYASMNREGFATVHFVGQAEDGAPVIQWGNRIFAESESELRMAPKKQTVYVNIYEQSFQIRPGAIATSAAFSTEADARHDAEHGPNPTLAVAVPIEIEV